MQSLYGSLIRRQTLNISHFKTTLACLCISDCKNHGSSLLSSDSSNTRPFRSLAPKYGCETEMVWLNLCGRAAKGPMNFLPSRSLTTSKNSAEDLTEPNVDVPPRIKFKRLDKTARHIMQILDKEAVEEVRARREIPDIKPGYTVRLKVEVPENKRRVSTIVGTVIARRNAGLNTTFRLRRMVAGVGIESLFPLYSPNIKEIEVLDDKKKVRRAKLYYLRDRMNSRKKR